MNKIEDYNQNISKYELYAHLSDQIVAGNIKTFSEIFTYAQNVNFEKIKDHETWSLSTVWGVGYKFEVKA